MSFGSQIRGLQQGRAVNRLAMAALVGVVRNRFPGRRAGVAVLHSKVPRSMNHATVK